MIIEPSELRFMARWLEGSKLERHAAALVEFHRAHRINDHNSVAVPMYWAKTVLLGLKKMREEFPQMKFGSIHEEKNRLKMFTIPTHLQVEKMKTILFNEIDDLILDTVNRLSKSDKKPHFLS